MPSITLTLTDEVQASKQNSMASSSNIGVTNKVQVSKQNSVAMSESAEVSSYEEDPSFRHNSMAGSSILSTNEIQQVPLKTAGSGSNSNDECPPESSVLLLSRDKALGNHIIMQKVAEFLPLDYLLQLRRTCTEWNRAFVSEIQNVSTPLRLIQSDPEEFWHIMQEYNYEGRRFVHFDKRFAPFGKFLDFVHFPLNLRYRSEIDRLRTEIFEVLPQLTDLEIQIGQFYSGDQTLSSTSLIPRSLPMLRRFEFDFQFGSGDLDYAEQEAKQLLIDIVSNASDLECLELRTDFFSEHSSYPIGPIGPLLLRNAHASTLKKLVLFDDGWRLTKQMAQELVALGSRGLQLTEFNFRIELAQNMFEFHEVTRLLPQFLNSQATTLQQLKIYAFSCTEANDFELQLPYMERLMALDLQLGYPGQPKYCDPIVTLQSSRLDLNFPHLKKLSYRSSFWHDFEPRIPHQTSHMELRDLTLGEFTPVAVRQLVPLCSSIVRLELKTRFKMSSEYPALLEHVSFVCSAWPLLEVLCLDAELWDWNDKPYHDDGLSEPNMDEVLTGVPKKFHSQSKLCAADLAEFQIRPGIGDLKHLREFTFLAVKHNYSHHARSRVTDVTGFYCFARPNSSLQRIRINDEGESLTPECRAIIQEALGLTCVLEVGFRHHFYHINY